MARIMSEGQKKRAMLAIKKATKKVAYYDTLIRVFRNKNRKRYVEINRKSCI